MNLVSLVPYAAVLRFGWTVRSKPVRLVVAALIAQAVLAASPASAETLDREKALALMAESLLTLGRYRQFFNAVSCVLIPVDDLKRQASVTLHRRWLTRAERDLKRSLDRVEGWRTSRPVPDKGNRLRHDLKFWRDAVAKVERRWRRLEAEGRDTPKCRRKAPAPKEAQ